MLQATKKIIFVFLFFVVFLLPVLNAQSYYFKNYSVEDGLPFVNVSVIFQDSKGNLWSGGYGGLSKFDGVSFTNYSPKEGLLNHSVTAITEDNNRNLWVGTIAGLNLFIGKKIRSFTIADGLPSNSITAAFKDKDGVLWFGTDKGLSKFQNNLFKNFSTKNGLVNDSVSCLYQDSKRNIWIGTHNGICIFDGKIVKTIFDQKKLKGAVVTSITEDILHTIWIATDKGLYKMFDGDLIPYSINKSQQIITKSIVADSNGLWLGTDNGLYRFENGQFRFFMIQQNQNSNLVACLYKDYEQNIWIGTYAGLFKYRDDPFVSYGAEDGLTDQFIYGIKRDSKNNLWVGSKNGGLFKQQNNRFIAQSQVKAKGVNAIYEYNKNELWLATDIGLLRYDGNKTLKNSDTSSVFKSQINCFYKDNNGNVWLGSVNKVYRYNGEKFQAYSFSANSSNCNVWTITQDINGTLWFGTYLGGLFKFDGKELVEYSKQLGFNSDSYLTSLTDSSGNIYWGTLDGMLVFNPTNNRIDHFGRADGMNSDLVYSSTFGLAQNEMWVGTNQGLNKIDLAEYKKSKNKIIIPFGKEDGFSGVECNSNGTRVDNDGSIWFGTVNGLIRYDPNKYLKNTAETKTTITGFRLFYADTLLNENVHLAYNVNNISFQYNGVCLTNPDKVLYTHILEGFEKNWSPPEKLRLVTYSNLPPGTYTFRVKSANNEGVWNKTSSDFSFTINKPFWKQWWFIITFVFSVTIAIVAIVQYRIYRIKRNEQRKTEINKKIAHLESQALRAQMNPHFIFNTLSSIQHYISNNNTDAALKYLSKFAKLMRKIMENSKQPMVTVAEELNALNLFLELEVMRFEKKFEYHINVDSNIDQNYDRIPSMLIQPYVENAIIHGLLPRQGNGKISINLQKQGDTIICIVEDNGIGRENSKQFKKNRVSQHKSMGMSITQDRLDALNAGLNSNISSEITDLFANGESAGTKVRLVIPVEEEM